MREHLQRTLIRQGDHDWAKPRDLIVQQFEHGIFQPALAESNARRHAARELSARARVRGMLKERQSCLLPEPFAEQNG